jgi:hypothetical protein
VEAGRVQVGLNMPNLASTTTVAVATRAPIARWTLGIPTEGMGIAGLTARGNGIMSSTGSIGNTAGMVVSSTLEEPCMAMSRLTIAIRPRRIPSLFPSLGMEQDLLVLTWLENVS